MTNQEYEEKFSKIQKTFTMNDSPEDKNSPENKNSPDNNQPPKRQWIIEIDGPTIIVSVFIIGMVVMAVARMYFESK